MYIFFVMLLIIIQDLCCADGNSTDFPFDFDYTGTDSLSSSSSAAQVVKEDGRARGGGRIPQFVTDDEEDQHDDDELPSAGSKRTRSVSPAENSPKDARTHLQTSHTYQSVLEEERSLPGALFADAEIPEFPTYSHALPSSSSASSAASSSSSSSSAAQVVEYNEEDLLTLGRKIIYQNKRGKIVLSSEDKTTIQKQINDLSQRYAKRLSPEERSIAHRIITDMHQKYPFEEVKKVYESAETLQKRLSLILNKGFILNEEELRTARSLLNEHKHGRFLLTPEEMTALNRVIKISKTKPSRRRTD
jgi:hypothetical protein